jgi:uncharacterized protein YdeI (YjbR/CyaY-like superfamily)
MSDPRIDDYIAGRAEFARPILRHLRAAVHRACPAAEETIRWSMPSFSYRGKILAQMAAFKAHASFGFWRGEAAGDAAKPGAMGQFGRLTRIEDLPPDDALDAMIRTAAALIDAAPLAPRPARAAPAKAATAAEMPGDLAAALDQAGARDRFDAFPPGARREYLDWVTGAKRPETRARRIETVVAQTAEGKTLHWRYQRS